ncbi:helix-turn-helix domain-containing protein [Conchiformibius kuhniae]|uniref:Helix-turn-helix domain-containing protein n=1 Tax=Conchiformibius kuhniae TaxID=211502 RepID=A0A8T9N0E4_9NEIS|nr:helix-turn-helix transcriptional regulator [Conchiformibius kuhniae]UOP05473.1 helix-turn-helix domain-containing protein [Conchiformibius kuhniae]
MPDFSIINRQIGKSIAKRRQQAGFTQEQVAEKLGIGYVAVSRMERGLVMPTVARLYQLAELFGCSSADLLDENSPLADDQARRLCHLFNQLQEHDRKLLGDIFQILSERLREP